MRKMITTLACALAVAVSTAGPKDSGRGREAFEKRCTGCHALDGIKEGPPLRGVYGRRAGTAPGFSYSDALQRASVTWDEKTLDQWLRDTESVFRGNDMSFRLDSAGERAEIIAYLKQLPGK